jgi:hypothetical protein
LIEQDGAGAEGGAGAEDAADIVVVGERLEAERERGAVGYGTDEVLGRGVVASDAGGEHAAVDVEPTTASMTSCGATKTGASFRTMRSASRIEVRRFSLMRSDFGR